MKHLREEVGGCVGCGCGMYLGMHARSIRQYVHLKFYCIRDIRNALGISAPKIHDMLGSKLYSNITDLLLI